MGNGRITSVKIMLDGENDGEPFIEKVHRAKKMLELIHTDM